MKILKCAMCRGELDILKVQKNGVVITKCLDCGAQLVPDTQDNFPTTPRK